MIMKNIVGLLVFFTISLQAYSITFDNQTGYPLQGALLFEPDAPCKKVMIAIPPQSPVQLPLRINVHCCTTSIKIQRADVDVLNRIEYDYEQQKTDEGLCTDTVILITRRSDNILELR